MGDRWRIRGAVNGGLVCELEIERGEEGGKIKVRMEREKMRMEIDIEIEQRE